jgi:hypothetical protein
MATMSEMRDLEIEVQELRAELRELKARPAPEPAAVPAQPIATVIDNNQPGWTNIIETAPNVTLPVGTKLYDQSALFAVGCGVADEIWRRESSAPPPGAESRHLLYCPKGTDLCNAIYSWKGVMMQRPDDEVFEVIVRAASTKES